MRTYIVKFISFALFVAVLLSCVPLSTSAATYRTAKNSVSSSYAGSVYYQNYLKINLTGDGATDVLAIALSQLGYHEGASVNDMAGNSSSSKNYTEYNYNMGKKYIGDYGGSTYPWCASFVSWCLYQSHCTDHGGETDICREHKNDPNYIWREIGCSAWVANLKAAGKYQYSKNAGGSYTPKSGDLIFFRSAAHIGLVLYTEGNYVYTVEGNTSDASGLEPEGGGVYFKSYSLSSSLIDGYGTLPYKTNPNVPKVDYSGKNPTAGYWITNTLKYLYADESCTTRARYTTGDYVNLSRFTMFEATGVTANKKALKVNFDGVDGYIALNNDRVIQVTSNVPVEKAEDNLASDRNYEISITNNPIVESQWGTDYSALLTDGVASDKFEYSDGSWFMLSASHNAYGYNGSITVEFDKICEITKLRLHLANNSTMEVKAPLISVYSSLDGVNFTKFGDMEVNEEADAIYWSNLEVDKVLAGIIRFDFSLRGNYAYVNEIEVHGTETANDFVKHSCEPISQDWLTDERQHWHVCSCNSALDAEEHTEGEWVIVEEAQIGVVGKQEKRCTVCEYLIAEEEIPAIEEPKPIGLRGDVNMNGEIDSRDYVTLKRAYFKTAILDETANKLADVNNNGEVDSRDYVTLKRVYFKTATIAEDIKYVY